MRTKNLFHTFVKNSFMSIITTGQYVRLTQAPFSKYSGLNEGFDLTEPFKVLFAGPICRIIRVHPQTRRDQRPYLANIDWLEKI